MAPEEIHHISLGMFSIARHTGACVIDGHRYTYNPATDTLIRDDVLRRNELAQRQIRNAERRKWQQMADEMQGRLI